MKYLKPILILLFGLLILSCDTDSSLDPNHQQVVIQAYLYENEPVQDIRITETLALGSEEITATPINNAQVQLIKNGLAYDLTPSEGDSGYYHYSGDDLTIQSGEIYEIQVTCDGNMTTGFTQVPAPPENVTISSNTIQIPEEFYPWEIDPTSEEYQITLTWDSEEDDLFFLTIENLEQNPDPVDTWFPGMESSDNSGFQGRGRFISSPTGLNDYSIFFKQIIMYGRHEVKVYRVNQEYADLYISRQQDSRDLNEPLSNIENGLGIFSAFSSSSVFFTAVKE